MARPAEGMPSAPEPRALPPLEPSEFQRFVQQSTGRLLPRFGASLFEDASSSFVPVENVPVTLDYLVGPGDELRIRVWGAVEGDHRSTVDRNGNIDIPQIGTVAVAGVRMDRLEAHVRAAIAKSFRNFELSVTLGQLRSIQVFVVGQARRPGSYTVSSLSTLVSALFASGGPSATGSMRRVQLRRGDKVVTEFDIYDFLARGDKSRDARLLAGDVIFIPSEGPTVALSGSVRVPGIYELKADTPLSEVLALAGGLASTAAGQRAMVERIEGRQVRRVEAFDLAGDGLKRTLRDGDVVSVQPISPRFANAVTLRGHVAMPMRHPFRPGMRVSDLIPEREALVVPDYYLRRNLITRRDLVDERESGQGVAGMPGRSMSQEQGPAAAGRVPLRRDGGADSGARDAAAPRDSNQLLEEIRDISRAEVNWDYAVVERLDGNDLTTRLIPFNLGQAVMDRNPEQNLVLQPGDVVTIFSRADFGVPAARRSAMVVLENEFRTPGVYQAQPGETLRQLVVRAGGLSPNAYLYGAVFTRESTRQSQQKALEEAIARMEVDLQRATAARAQNVLPGDADALGRETAAQQGTLQRLRQLRATGRIVFNLPEQPQLADIPDLPLENGDRLMVPQRPAIVSVLGSVYNAGTFVHRNGQRVGDYIRLAGGPLRTADDRAIYIQRADGSLASRRQSGWLAGGFENLMLMPGDSVVVPENFEYVSWTRTLRDWSQIFFQFGLGAAAIKVLRD
jgi:protein involved in polysaccharide export with SLBB domain